MLQRAPPEWRSTTCCRLRFARREPLPASMTYTTAITTTTATTFTSSETLLCCVCVGDRSRAGATDVCAFFSVSQWLSGGAVRENGIGLRCVTHRRHVNVHLSLFTHRPGWLSLSAACAALFARSARHGRGPAAAGGRAASTPSRTERGPRGAPRRSRACGEREASGGSKLCEGHRCNRGPRRECACARVLARSHTLWERFRRSLVVARAKRNSRLAVLFAARSLSLPSSSRCASPRAARLTCPCVCPCVSARVSAGPCVRLCVRQSS